MTLQCRKHWSSFQFLLRVSPKRYIFLPIIIYLGRKTKETGVTFYYLIYFPLKFDLFMSSLFCSCNFLYFVERCTIFGGAFNYDNLHLLGSVSSILCMHCIRLCSLALLPPLLLQYNLSFLNPLFLKIGYKNTTNLSTGGC